MHSKSLSLVAGAFLSAALASCGSGSSELARAASGAVPGQEEAGWQRAVSSVKTARSNADERMDAAVAAPSATAIQTARAAISAYVEAAEAAASTAERLQSPGAGDRGASARSALNAAQAYRAANERRLNNLQAVPSGSGSDGNVDQLVQTRLRALRVRPPTNLELGYEYRNTEGSIYISKAQPCSESDGACIVDGKSLSAEQYLSPAFFSSSHTTSRFADRINGVDGFSQGDEFADPFSSEREGYRQLLALGKYSAARMDINRNFFGASLHLSHFGAALGERHSGRPDGSSGSAAWRGRMVGVAMESGSSLAGESALTYSFADNTVDVEISGIRAIDDVVAYTGGTSFAWTGLAVNSDGSFHIPGYNNDRSDLTLSLALHSTLGYIDGDFYGPNAEEAAGIFTRDNVNGAFVAGSRGGRTSAADETPSGGGQTPSDEEPPSEGRQAPQDGNALSLTQRLANFRSRTLTSLERGPNYRKLQGEATRIDASVRCSESTGTCFIVGIHQGGNLYFSPRTFFERYPRSVTPLTTAPANGVDSFSYYHKITESHSEFWHLLALGQFSAASTLHIFQSLSERESPRYQVVGYSDALGERHAGRPSDPDGGSATWRGQMVGGAMDNGSPLAGKSTLTHSFADNTVDVEISEIRAIDDNFAYAGSSEFEWRGLSVNSDGSFYIPGYNNDRSDLTMSSALHPTLGYIDGDFFGPNAEEAAGIFTRDNVNGAFVAKK